MDIDFDIKKEIMTDGWWILIATINEAKKCSCYNNTGANYEDRDLNCSICFGTGFQVTKRLVKARYHTPKADDKTSFWGSAPQDSLILYTCISTNFGIKDSDKIFLIDLDSEGIPIMPLRVIDRYNVVSAQEKRGFAGNTAFWTLWLDKEKG